MPPCPPPPQCDPTDEILVAPLEPGIADAGLIFLEYSPKGIEPARLAEQGRLERAEGAQTTIVGYGTTTPKPKRAVRRSELGWQAAREDLGIASSGRRDLGALVDPQLRLLW